MGCSEARPHLSRSVAIVSLQLALAVSPASFAADPPPATQHETKKPNTNRLATETSPYLLLHAHNPVDWRPWGPEALQAAKDANKPIFLSVGYSSCYWCHVMEREVFENEEIARYVNEHFICIKVDREERPDIDDQYMLALQLYFQAIGAPQGGGWPMSMFLTPDAKPFAGGTYFPAEDKENQPGFRTVAEQVQTLWTTREADLRNNADVLASAVKRYSQPGLSLETVALDESLVTGAVDALLATCDPEHGGVYNPVAPDGPKFPSAPNLELLSSWSYGRQDAEKLDDGTQSRLQVTQDALDRTLTRMAMGGIRDHVGGGFHRYSVDREWRVPHFEKMLYDQALIAEVYLHEYMRTQNPLYKQVAQETLDFVLREMTSPEGGFYSALDAETDGVEGQYYVWSRDEIDAVLGAEDAKLFAAAYGLDQESNFEHGHVLYLPQSLEQTAQQLRMPIEELVPRLAAMREKLLSVRRERPALLRDEKILTSWNGLMIMTLAQARGLDGTDKYLRAAERAASFILSKMRDDEGRLLHSYAGGKAGIKPYLDDYAYVVSGLLELHHNTVDGTTDWEQAARSLMDDQFVLFWDARGSGFWYTADDHEPLLARIKDANDSVLPNPNAVSVVNLVWFSGSPHLSGYLEPAGESLQLFAAALKNSPTSSPGMVTALQLYLKNAPGGQPVAEDDAAEEPQLALADADPLIPAAEATDVDIKRHDKLSAVAYLSHDKVPAGGECYVAVVLEVKKDWHINANPAQPDYLEATKLTGTFPGEITLSDVRYPTGHDFRQKGLDDPLKVYEGRVILYGRLKAPAAAAGQAVGAEFTVSYQCCNDKTCLAPKKLVLTGGLIVAAQGEKPRPINQSLFKRREK